MKTMRIFAVLTTAAGTLLAPSPGYGQSKAPVSTSPSISIALSAQPDVIKIGSEVRVKAALRNESQELIFVPGDVKNRKVGEFTYDVEVRDEAGSLRPTTIYYRKAKGSSESWGDPPGVITMMLISLGDRMVPAGETLTLEIVVSKLYDMSKPGKYLIQVHRPDPVTGAIVKSNVVSMTVTN